MTNETKTKHCHGCDTTQTVEAFYKNKSTRDGFQTQCKSCVKVCVKAYSKANKAQIAEYHKVYRQANKEHIAEQKKTYHEDNREQRLEQMKVYKQANRETMTQAERAARASVDKARARSELSSAELYGGLTYTEACAMTLPFVEERLRLEAETGVAHHIDHIVPVAAGGTHTACNLQVLSAAENLAKIPADKLLVAEYKGLTDA